MSRIFRGKSLASEYVPQMAVAIITEYFYTPPIRIGFVSYGPFYFVVKAWPSASATEFIATVIEWSLAAPTNEDAIQFEIVVFACKRHLGTLVGNDALFFRGEGIPVFLRFWRHDMAAFAIR